MEVGLFTWEATWKRILTLDQIKRKGWILANRCNLCEVKEESTDHILPHCTNTII